MSQSPPPAGLLPARTATLQSVLDKFGAPRATASPPRSARGGAGSRGGAGALAAAPSRPAAPRGVKAVRSPATTCLIDRVYSVVFTNTNHGAKEREDGKRALDGRIVQVRETGWGGGGGGGGRGGGILFLSVDHSDEEARPRQPRPPLRRCRPNPPTPPTPSPPPCHTPITAPSPLNSSNAPQQQVDKYTEDKETIMDRVSFRAGVSRWAAARP
jgi:hypothetical protein